MARSGMSHPLPGEVRYHGWAPVPALPLADSMGTAEARKNLPGSGTSLRLMQPLATACIRSWQAEVAYPSTARRVSLAREAWALTAPLLIPMAAAICASDRSA